MASSADGRRLLAGEANGLFTSTDSGVTWTAQAAGYYWQAVASSADGTKLLAAVNGGQLYTSGWELGGGQGQAVTLQYRGNGQWQPAQLPAGV